MHYMPVRGLMHCSRFGFRSLRLAKNFGAYSDHTAVGIKSTAFSVLKSIPLLNKHTN